jgi:putative ABC transport system permease protein
MMTPLRMLQVALGALLRNKMRSFLTVLGVVIGVGAVIAMVSIGEGAKARVAQSFESIGTNMLVVRSGSSQRGGVRGGAGSRWTLTWDDLEAIRREVPAVRHAAPQVSTSAQVLSEEQNWQTSVEGTSPELFDVRNWPIASGRRFTAAEVTQKARVAVLGKTVVDNLFYPGANPVGQQVRINRIPFDVVGVAAEKGSSGRGGDSDDVVMIPVTTFSAKVQGGLQSYIRGSIFVSAISQEATQQAKQGIEQLLRRRHQIRPGGDDDFNVRDLSELASAQQESASTITSLLAGVALVSLLVGGIGIMNIMLVSVTERTREIGLRMAIGARPRQILAQFLCESVALALVGGMLGIASGIGAASYLSGRFGWPMLIRPDVVAVAVGFSAAVGILFGLYPARKASLLDPIQALRYE